MTTLTGNISSLAQAQFEAFFAALETAPNLEAELNTFADALDLGFVNGSLTAKEISLSSTQYVIDVFQSDGTTKLGTVTYTGTGFIGTDVGSGGQEYIANDVFGVGSTITGIGIVNTAGYNLWHYAGNMNIVTMVGGEVTQGSFNVTELRMGSPGVGVEMVLTGDLTIGVATGTTGTLSGTITGMTQYVRQGGEAYKITIGSTTGLTPTATLLQDAMGDIHSTTSNLGGTIDSLIIDRLTYTDATGQTPTSPPSTNLVTLSNLDLTPADLESLMFAMDHSLGADMTFGDHGVVVTPITMGDDLARGILLEADGQVLVGGTTGPAGFMPEQFSLARYNADGTLDNGFGTNGVFISSPSLPHAQFGDMALVSGGKILFAGGYADDPDGAGEGPWGMHTLLVRLNSNGSIDTSFGVGGLDATDGVAVTLYGGIAKAMAVQGDGKILTAGDDYTAGFVVHRFTADGNLDVSFDTDGTVTAQVAGGQAFASDMVIQSDMFGDKYLVGGTNISNGKFVVARFNADGTLDNTFDADGWQDQIIVGNTNSHLAAMALQSDGKIILVGSASSPMNGDENVVVVRLNANGSVDNSFGFGSGKLYAGNFNTMDHATSVVIDPLNGDIIVGGDSGGDSTIWRFSSFGGFGEGPATVPFGMGGIVLARQPDGALVLAGSAQGEPGNNMDFTVGRMVESNTTMDQILFGGNDTLTLSGGTNIPVEISGFTGNDSITGGSGNDTLQGGAGADTVIGGSGNDRLMGDEGIDSLMGGAGNDWLEGGSGNDTLNGGTETDTASYQWAISGVTVTLVGGGATGVIDTLGGTDTLVSIENIYGSMHNDTLVGDINVNKLDGSLGNDILTGDAGNDTLIGGMGADALNGGDGTADFADYSGDLNLDGNALGVVVNLSGITQDNSWQGISFNVLSGNALDGWGNTDGLSNIENITGSAYNDFIVGSGANNYINGGAGADLIVGAAGNDTLDGGTVGPDKYQDMASYKGAAVNTGLVTGVTVNLGTGIATGAAGSVDSDVLRNFDGVVGSQFNDRLTGGSASADFTGFKQEFFNGLGGDDTIDGGRGTSLPMDAGNLEFNQAIYSDSTGPVDVNLTTGTATGGDSGSDTLIGINAVRGSNHADTLTGSNASVEFFEGGGGGDTIDGGNGFDWAMYRTAASGVSVTLGLGTGTASDGDTLTSIEGVIGSNGNDTLTGGDGDDRFQGRQGNDRITVGAGTDTIDYGSDQDANGDGFGVAVNLSTVTQSTTWQGVFVSVVTGTAQDGWVNIDTFVDRGNVENIRGSSYNDFLVGNGLSNSINGGDGADLLIGNAGNDTLDGGNVGDSKYQDWVSYLGAGQNGASGLNGVSVNLGLGTATGKPSADPQNPLPGEVGTDTLWNIDGVTGSNYNDSLVGGSNSTDFRGLKQEFFNGRGGDDTIDGGLTAPMDASNVEMNFAMYHETTGFGVNVNLTTGTATGNGGSNTSVGNDTLSGGINAVRGSNFADVLTGSNTYAEFFEGDGGNDIINGGTGNDYAMYRSAQSGVTVDLANGTASDGKGGTDTLIGIENVVGSDFDDLILGDAGNNTLQGRKGSDSFDGGTGTDWADYSNDQNDNGDSLGVVVNLSGATQTSSWQGVSFNVLSGQALDGWGNTDFFLNRDSFENIRGSIYSDFLVGNGYANEIVGGKGGDLLVGLAGNDTLDGGTVGPDFLQDWVSYFSAGLNGTVGLTAGLNGVSVNLGLGTASGKLTVGVPVSGEVDNDTLLNIDGVSGSTFNDSLVGGSDSSDFKGFKQEFFVGYAGNDTIDGGRAAVPMDASNLEMNMAMYHQTTGTIGVVVDLAAGTATGAVGMAVGIVDTDTLIGINAVRGSNNNDTLTGGNALFDYVEFFEGGGGDDSIDGGSRVGFDYAMYTAATSGVYVNLATGSATGDASVGNDTLISIEGVIGSSFNDTIIGGAADEKLKGGKGNDALDGGAGKDWAYYDADQDDNGDGFGVIVNLAQGSAVDGWGGIDTLANFENIRGSIYSDHLTGNDSDNVIWAQGGNDTITGGLGGDTAVYTGLKTDYTVERAGAGYTVTHNLGGPDGVDTLYGIEKLQFSDGAVNLGSKLLQNDFNGDGKADLRWQKTDGTVGLWLMDGVNATAQQNIGPYANWSVIDSQHDFNGDGKSDLLWTNADGRASISLMNGVDITVAENFGPYAGWSVVDAKGDYNGDGKADLRWQKADGTVGLWLMDGVNPTAMQNIGPYAGWSVLDGQHDFNGDGKSDLLWTNTDGRASISLMNGVDITVAENFGPYAGWSVVDAKGDYNGDGKADLRWQNTDGTVGLWLMDGVNATAMQNIGPYAGWSVLDGQHDFNGDGKSDLLWTNTDGRASISLMNGVDITVAENFGPYAGWSVVDAKGDYNGDGKADLRWQKTDGTVGLWLMDGVTVTAAENFGPYAGWSVKDGSTDVNGDGKTDLMWTKTDGTAAVWLMDGVNLVAAENMGPYAGWSLA